MGLLSKVKKAAKKVVRKTRDVAKKVTSAGVTVGTLGLVKGESIVEPVSGILSGGGRAIAKNLGIEGIVGKPASKPKAGPEGPVDEDPAGVGDEVNALAMPSRSDAEMQRARRKAMLLAASRTGRLSTLLSDKSY